MKKGYSIIATLLFLLITVFCIAYILWLGHSEEQSMLEKNLDIRTYNSIVIGKTTKEQVKKIYGEPTDINTSIDNFCFISSITVEDTWCYVYNISKLEEFFLRIILTVLAKHKYILEGEVRISFDKKGIVKSKYKSKRSFRY